MQEFLDKHHISIVRTRRGEDHLDIHVSAMPHLDQISLYSPTVEVAEAEIKQAVRKGIQFIRDLLDRTEVELDEL